MTGWDRRTPGGEPEVMGRSIWKAQDHEAVGPQGAGGLAKGQVSSGPRASFSAQEGKAKPISSVPSVSLCKTPCREPLSRVPRGPFGTFGEGGPKNASKNGWVGRGGRRAFKHGLKKGEGAARDPQCRVTPTVEGKATLVLGGGVRSHRIAALARHLREGLNSFMPSQSGGKVSSGCLSQIYSSLSLSVSPSLLQIYVHVKTTPNSRHGELGSTCLCRRRPRKSGVDPPGGEGTSV
ncbi:UNVERIFIED_CONTAM: hypothetical protein K2H54_077252 [Gekko kuhli]